MRYTYAIAALVVSFLTSAAHAGSVTLTLVPSHVDAQIGQQFSVDIRVHTGGAQIDSAGAHLDFDPSIVAVTSITPSPAPWNPLWMHIAGGQVDYEAGTFTPSNQDFTLATVHFVATALGSTSLAFVHDDAANRVTGAALAGDTSVFGSATGGSVTVSALPTAIPTITPNVVPTFGPTACMESNVMVIP